jgi:uncharacterized membrane protein YbhN (UPF0104 family)
MGLLKKILPFLGIFLFFWILFTQISFQNILYTIENISSLYMIISIVFMLILAILKYSRIFIFLRVLGVNLSASSLLRIYTSSVLLSQVTTFIVSIFAATTATIVSNKGEKKLRIGNAYIADNIFDLLFAVLIFIICIFFDKDILQKLSFNRGKLVFITVFVIPLIAISFLILKFRYKEHYKEITSSIRKILVPGVITTIVIWIFYTLTCLFEAKAFGVSVPIPYLLTVYISGSIITALPISIGGLGTRDIVFIYLLSLKGIPNEVAFLLSLFSYILNPSLSMFLLYLISIIVKDDILR